jgi:YfiH family protein
MPFHQSGLIRYFSFENMEAPSVIQAVFTRQGGVSPEPWDSLNMGGYLGDPLENTYLNRVRAFETLKRDPQSVFDVWQVHSAEVVCSDRPRPRNAPHQKADAILTDNPAITLFMRFADCVPVLFYDPVKQVIGIAHAGWQGTVKRVVSATVEKMAEFYGSHPADIRAGIGPSIAAHHYQVGPEVVQGVRETFGVQASAMLPSKNGSVYFDLWAANRLLLEQAGVEQIEISGLCTACNPQDWFSHRGEQGKTGRFGALIALREM